MNSSAPASRAAWITSGARHGGIAERDVLVDGAVEQHVLLQHDADLAPQPAGIELGDVDAVEHHLALRRVKPLDTLESVDLPEPEGPTKPITSPAPIDSETFFSASAASGR